MSGQQRTTLWCLSLCLLTFSADFARAQSRTANQPLGGITFNPPRRAAIRHKGGQLIRGELIGISPELIRFRLANGKEFQYDFHLIRSIATIDGDFRYASAYDTYREVVEKARGLAGVTISASSSAAGTGNAQATTVLRPPPPSLPVMLDSPENYEIAEIEVDQSRSSNSDGPQPMAQIPPVPTAPPAAAAGAGGANQPIYETDGFKIVFLIACFAVILLWWRNRVG